MLVKEIMKKDVWTTFPENTVKEAAKLMCRYGVGSLVVINKIRKIVGIVTERDLIRDILSQGKDPNFILVKDVMSTDVITIDGDKTLEEATDTMVEHNIKKLPVMDGDRLVGVITATDVITANSKLVKKMSKLLRARPEEEFITPYYPRDDYR